MRRLTRQHAPFTTRWSRVLPGGRGRASAIFALFAVVCLTVGGGLAQLRIDTRVESLLPADDSALEAVEQKAEAFGGEPIVVLLESEKPGELLLKQQNLGWLLQLEGELAQLPDVAAVYGPATVLNQIAAASQGMLAQISGRRDALRHEAERQARADGADAATARRAGRRVVAQFDRRYGSLLAQGLPAGLPTLRNPRFVQTVIFDDQGRPRPQWRFVHPKVNIVAVLVRPRGNLDAAAAGRLVDGVRSTVAGSRLAPERVTVTGLPVVTSGLTERAHREFPVLGAIAIIAVGLIFFLAPWSRRRRSRLQPVAAALIGTSLTVSFLGWLDRPLSLGAVAFVPILMGVGSDFALYLSQAGNRRRALAAAIAAAAGFASLAISPLPFVREFGLALALGILVTVGVTVAMRKLFGAVPPPLRQQRSWRGIPTSPRWQRLAVMAAAVGVAALGVGALPQLELETRPDELARGLPELVEARHAEDVLQSSAEVSIVLKGTDVTTPESLEWARRAEEQIVRLHGDQMHPVITMPGLLSFLGPEPTAQQVRAGVALLPPYLSSTVLRPDRSEALLTFGTQVHDLQQQRVMLDRLSDDLPPPPDGFEVEIVGLPVAAVKGLDQVSGERVLTNALGIAAAGLVLAVFLRNRRDVARAVLTVSLAFGWTLTLVWLTIGSLSPLTVAIGSLTVATGCEFAVMLADAHRTRRSGAVASVAIAALAGSVGYLVLGLSHVAVLREFGILLAVSVVLSFVAARLVVWALPPAPTGEPRAEQGLELDLTEPKGVLV